VRTIYEAFNVRDIDRVLAPTHPDIAVHPLRTQSAVPIHGRDAFREWLQNGVAAGRTHRFEIDDVRELDDGAVVLVGRLVAHGGSIEVIGVHRLKDRLSWRVDGRSHPSAARHPSPPKVGGAHQTGGGCAHVRTRPGSPDVECEAAPGKAQHGGEVGRHERVARPQS
jgi:SnoaL-like domain